jgi:hypothetical protein
LINKIRQGFLEGQLVPDDWPLSRIDIGANQWNDCIILGMAIGYEQSADWALTPYYFTYDNGQCSSLKNAIFSNDISGFKRSHYHRYILAQPILARYLLQIFSIAGLRPIYKTSIYAILCASIFFQVSRMCIAVRRKITDRPSARREIGEWQDVYLFSVYTAFLTSYGLEYFGQSLGHGPADFVTLLFACLVSVLRFLSLSTNSLLALAALYGSLTMMFEFLTGGIPLGAAIILGTFPLLMADFAAPRVVCTTVSCLIAFLAAAAICYAIKIGAAMYQVGPQVFSDVATGLEFRMSSEPIYKVAGALAQQLNMIGSGSRFVGEFKAISGIMVSVYFCYLLSWNSVRKSFGSYLAVVLILSLSGSAAIFLWMMLFRNHTVEHAWFMCRILVWPIASGYAMLFSCWCHHTLAHQKWPPANPVNR